MTPDDKEDRRIAGELSRRERRERQQEPSIDPATLRALLEAHETAVEQIVARTEAALADRIDTLGKAQDAVAGSLRHEIEQGRKKGSDGEHAAALVRQLGEEQRAAAKELLAGLRESLDAITRSLDAREGAVFDRIDRVAETVTPGARALAELKEAVAGTVAAARDVAAIREATVGSRKALGEVAALKLAVAGATRASEEVAAMGPVLEQVAAGQGRWNANVRRLRWLGWTLIVLLAIAFGTGGVALQREMGIWPSSAEVENRERDAFWERHGGQVTRCIEVARASERGMSCVIVDMDP